VELLVVVEALPQKLHMEVVVVGSVVEVVVLLRLS